MGVVMPFPINRIYRPDSEDEVEEDPEVTDRVRIVIIDDHPLVAEGLASTLATDPLLCVVGVASTVADGVEQVLAAEPDVVVMDYRLPDGTGVEATRLLRDQSKARVVMITGTDRDEVVTQAIEAGAIGFVRKSARGSEIIAAVKSAAIGEAYITQDLVLGVVQHLRQTNHPTSHELTAREVDVLRLLALGRSAGEIATELGLSTHTSRNHIRHVLTKLDAHTQLQAVVTALRMEILDLESLQ